MAMSQNVVLKLYNSVIEDVISGVRESFIDEGVDEQVLQELKQIWETKLMASKAVELNPDPIEPQPPQINANKSSSASNKGSFTQKTNATNHVAHQQNQQQQAAQPVQQVVAPQQSAPEPTPQPAAPAVVQPALLDRQVPIQITLPAQTGVPNAQPRVLTIQVPASAIQGNQLHTVLTGPVITAAMGLPANVASAILQQHVNSTLLGQQQGQAAGIQVVTTANNNNVLQQRTIQNQGNVAQLDGPLGDSSDEEEEEEEDDNEDLDDEDLEEKDELEEQEDTTVREEEPLNSEDDVTDDDPADLFETDNVVVCQYDKITRSRNKWKFYLKDGIMNLSGKDFVFQKANGDAEW